MPGFPGDRLNVTQAAFPLLAPAGLAAAAAALGITVAELLDLDVPGLDLQLPFTRDARSGGTEFFHAVGAVSQRPRKLIMQTNPSTGTPTFFRHAGRPIMFSGDKALCKQMEKLRRPRPRR